MVEAKSKRMTCSRRYRIEHKIAEHRRKERKEAKNNPKKHKLKKDPGIPNLWPLKDQLLNKIEQHKKKLEDEKTRQKKARDTLFNKNRNLGFSSIAEDASKRNEAFDNVSTLLDAAAIGKKDNTQKAYYKALRSVIDAADVILEVLDARDPLGCRAKEIEEMIINNKNLAQWLEYLRKEYPTIAFKSSTQTQRKNLGADTLVKLLKNYSRNLDIKTSITVGVIGFPNVGKSSLINSLKRAKVCGVGASPGSTKSMQEIHLDKNIKLLDCPGIVFTNNDRSKKNKYEEILLRNFIKIELLDNPIPPVELIVSRFSKQLMARYNVPIFKDTDEFLIFVARQTGRLKRGGIPDLESAAKLVLQDWNSGKIPYFTTPPPSIKSDTILDTQIVSTWRRYTVSIIDDDDETIPDACNGKNDVIFQTSNENALDFVEASLRTSNESRFV
ncbi:3354_t:CDS:2 [Entrophospora sp. SA101]|nr:3354_t:CDS:2 [Entrophospora sp. SA101]